MLIFNVRAFMERTLPGWQPSYVVDSDHVINDHLISWSFFRPSCETIRVSMLAEKRCLYRGLKHVAFAGDTGRFANGAMKKAHMRRFIVQRYRVRTVIV